MNSNENEQDQSGNLAVRNTSDTSADSRPGTGDVMKRAAAKQLIERYYYQLTDGCGNENCTNSHCASSKTFSFANIKERNELAVKAIDLFKEKAILCGDSQPPKVPRSECEPGPSGQASSSSRVEAPQASSSKAEEVPVSSSSSKSTVKALFTQPSTCSVIKPLPSPVPEVHSYMYLTEQKVADLIKLCKEENSWSKLIRVLGSTFNNADSLIMSFRKSESAKNKSTEDVVSEEISSAKTDDEADTKSKDDSAKQGEEASSDVVESEGDSKDLTEGKESEDVKDNNGDSKQTKPVQESLSFLSSPVQESLAKDSVPVQESSGSVSVIEDDLSVDITAVRRAYDLLMDIPDLPYQGALVNALTSLSKSVEMELRYRRPVDQNPHYINIFVIVMELPLLDTPEFIETAFPAFCKAMGHLPIQAQVRLAKIWSKYGEERLHEMVMSLHQLITVRIAQHEGRWGRGFYLNDDDGISGATKVMRILYYASILGGKRDSEKLLAEEKAQNETEENLQDIMQGAFAHDLKEAQKPKEDALGQELKVSPLDCRKPLVEYEDFVNELLNEYIDIEADYKYKIENDVKFSFMNHCFILNTASKHMCMYYDNRVRMFNERRTSILQTFMHGLPPIPFLRLRVRRTHLIDDALVALEMTAMDNPQDLKKQLFVEFDGEQGLDEGGVSKEFFELVIEEIFNPDFGMFTYNEETRQFWFNSTSFENDGQFVLIGIMLGLAIYNSTIVDVHFPSVVYRKLMGKKGLFQDLFDVDPTLAKSLQQLLDYTEKDIEDVFMQTFSIGYKDVFGSDITHDLKENGSSIAVTHSNKQEFVDLYTDFILNKSIEKQFRAFKRGFHMVVNESPLRVLFRPEEVELLICGSTHFDFHDLENATEYDGGFTAESPSIRHFWEIVHDFSEEQKRKLLAFTTGTDRVPVGGLAKLKLIIARNGPDSERLPTAHTCFNVLLLPDYSSKEKLRERLEKAINYSKGFGML